MDIFDHRTYPNYLARDIGDFIVVLTTEPGTYETRLMLELASEDADLDGGLDKGGFGLGFDQADDEEWPPRANPT